jgi:hypothetical protein
MMTLRMIWKSSNHCQPLALSNPYLHSFVCWIKEKPSLLEENVQVLDKYAYKFIKNGFSTVWFQIK